MNHLIQPLMHRPTGETSHPSLTGRPVFSCGPCVVMTQGAASSLYFCPAGTNLAEVNTACCCPAAVCRRDPVRGRRTCRSHGCSMTQQLSDHWWQVGEPVWHTGPLIVRLLICLYRLGVCAPANGPDSSLWSLNGWQRLRRVYCHRSAQNMCLRAVLVSLVQPHAMRRQSVGSHVAPRRGKPVVCVFSFLHLLGFFAVQL